MNLFIGIAGRKQVGKDTVASRFAQALVLAVYTLATPITKACASVLGMSHSNFLALDKDYYLPGLKTTKRQFMCDMGDLLVGHNSRYLMEYAEASIEKDEDHPALCNGVIITDIRTPAEAEWVRRKNGIVVHVINPNAPRDTMHRTEVTLPILSQDQTITNDDTLDALQMKTDMLIELIKFNSTLDRLSAN